MRALFVVFASESLECLGLRCPVGRWLLGQWQHGQVEALMASILLRLARLDALQDYAELYEAHRQRRQPGDAGRREWRTIVASEPIRQAVFLEGSLKHRPGFFFRRRAGRRQRQQVAARPIHHRQRLAAPAVAGPEPALVVPRPQRVRSLRFRPWTVTRRPPTCAPPPDKAMPLQDLASRRDCRPATT